LVTPIVGQDKGQSVTDNEVRDNGSNLAASLSTADGGLVWLSYPELARLRGINLTSAFRLAKRHGWRRQKGNDGKLRVLVPALDRTIDLDKSGDQGRTTPGKDNDLAQVVAAIRSDMMEVVKPLQDAIAVLEVQLTEANARADRAEADRRQAEQAAVGERARAEVLRDERDKAKEAARIVTDALDVAKRADEARRGKGRLRRAWDGWRGR
jgi:hypothetical protein